MSLANLSKFGVNYLWRTPGICHNLATKHSYYTYSLEPSQPIPGRKPSIVDSPAQAVECIKSDQTVFIQGAAGTPIELVEAMTAYGKRCKLRNVTVCHMYTEGTAEYCHQDYKDNFRTVSFFMNKNVRNSVYDGRADTVPIFLHEVPLLFHKQIFRPDVSLIQVTPPDKHGYCSLGTSVDCVRAALTHSKCIVAQLNKQMPRTFGDSIIHQSHIDVAVCVDTPLQIYPLQDVPPTAAQTKLAKILATKLIDNGATLQLGIGSLQNAIYAELHNHKDLGIHSEMLSTGIVDLTEKGCVTNAKKPFHRGRTVASLVYGLKKLYDFVDDNPSIELMDIYYVNNPKIISQMPKMTAINSCIEIDLTGQVCSDSIGKVIYSGFGGHVDFTRGAAEGVDGLGKPIIALQSLTIEEQSKIVPYLKKGAGVVTSRAHVHYVVTEFGIASLFGKSLRQRAHALIEIAHPDHRDNLEKAAFDRLKCMPSR